MGDVLKLQASSSFRVFAGVRADTGLRAWFLGRTPSSEPQTLDLEP